MIQLMAHNTHVTYGIYDPVKLDTSPQAPRDYVAIRDHVPTVTDVRIALNISYSDYTIH
jgi:hypothetical protein